MPRTEKNMLPECDPISLVLSLDNRIFFPYIKVPKTVPNHVRIKKEGIKMIATKPVDLRARLKDYLDNAFNGEPVIVSRKNNKNVVILSEREYNELMKAKRNAEYLAKINESVENHEKGHYEE